MEESEIKRFYESTNVLITGGTGFMGKILIEKLLRSTDIDTLYLLVREKQGKNVHTRIDELFDDVLFDRLKKECPKFKYRVQPLPGDCIVAGLGLSIINREILISKVNIIFHVAATVKFNENLKDAFDINVNGTKDLIDLAKDMKNLKSMIYVSTAYSNCPNENIDEIFYDCPHSYRDVGDLLAEISKQEADMLTPKMIGDFPNTYTFTKCLAESMIKNIGHGIPLGIFRPSIVTSTYKEPIECWVDNFHGASGIFAGALSGAIRLMPCHGEKVADIVPVDTCVAGLLASAWEVGTKDSETTSKNILIYNYVSSPENPLTWNEYLQMNHLYQPKYPPSNIIFSEFIFITSWMWYKILRIFYHLLPAILMDIVLVLTVNKPRMIYIYEKIHKSQQALSYFTLRSWNFRNNNIVNLWKKLNSTDKVLFPLSMTTVHWTVYFRKYLLGIRTYLLKDPECSIDNAIERMKRLKLIYWLIKYSVIYGLSHLAVYLIFKLLRL